MAQVALMAEHNGGWIHRHALKNFVFNGERLPLIDQGRGIRNPLTLSSTLSILMSNTGPYTDQLDDDGFLQYSYGPGEPDAGDNRKLRRALDTRMPIILFRKEVENVYTPIMPAYVIEANDFTRKVTIAFDESFLDLPKGVGLPAIERRYALRLATQRLHQPAFRSRVVHAYAVRCAVCTLRIGRLLDAAHIVPDSEQDGYPTVNNGLALCEIHHAAFDQDLLSVTPSYKIEIAPDVLEDSDGPMLRHGLQEMHGRALTRPEHERDWPSPERLAWRYERFKASA
jgi:putative restriction endonuclease